MISFREALQADETHCLQDAKKLMPELQNWAWPLRGSYAELTSLKLQCSNFRHGREPSQDEKNQVLYSILADYPKGNLPEVFCKTELLINYIDKIMDEVNGSSNPGVPWSFYASTNKEFMEKHRFFIIVCVYERLIRLMTTDISKLSAVDLVKGLYCDPIRLFVKQEAHKVKKIQEGRFRLIMSVSLIDQIVERVLFSFQNKMEIEQWIKCPSKPGMGFTTMQNEALLSHWKNLFQRMVSSDISAWDWSVKKWLLDLDCEARKMLANYVSQENYNNWSRMVNSRFVCVARSVLTLSNGQMYSQLTDGIQKSGSYNTSSSNSRMRYAIAKLIGAENVNSMGDDAVEEFVLDAVSKYRDIGFEAKQYDEVTLEKGVEFCSHKYFTDHVQAISWPKQLFHLLGDKNPTMELLAQFISEMSENPELRSCLEVLRVSGWGQQNNV